MVNYLLKKSYQRNTLKEIKFTDLWNKNGVFTTMWLYSKPPKILFLKSHIQNLIKSLKAVESEFNALGGSSSVPISIRRSRVAIVNDLCIPCVIRRKPRGSLRIFCFLSMSEPLISLECAHVE